MRMPRRLFERLLGCSVERRPVSDTGYWSDASRIALAADTDWEQPSVPGLRELVIVQPHLRSEEHTSELQSLMRISYAVFCLKKKNKKKNTDLKSLMRNSLAIFRLYDNKEPTRN